MILISIQQGTKVSEASGGYDMMATWGDSPYSYLFADGLHAGIRARRDCMKKIEKNLITGLTIAGDGDKLFQKFVFAREGFQFLCSFCLV